MRNPLLCRAAWAARRSVAREVFLMAPGKINPTSHPRFLLMPVASCLLPFLHRMILFARANTSGGIVKPSVFAVFRLITNSNFVGCSTGKSAGLAPLRILST